MATIMQEGNTAVAMPRHSFELPDGFVANLRAIVSEYGANFADLLDILVRIQQRRLNGARSEDSALSLLRAAHFSPQRTAATSDENFADTGADDLAVVLREGGTGQPCYLDLDANPEVYTPDSLAILGACLVRLLEQICLDPSVPLHRLQVLSAEERAQLLQGFNDTAAALTEGTLI